MAYATIQDIEARIGRELTESEQAQVSVLLDDAGVYIDTTNTKANDDVKKIVSCNMVIRAIDTGDSDIPLGATQGSMSALGYSQSWTVSGGGSYGELYFSKTDKRLLGLSNQIGSYSPTQELAPKGDEDEGHDSQSV